MALTFVAVGGLVLSACGPQVPGKQALNQPPSPTQASSPPTTTKPSTTSKPSAASQTSAAPCSASDLGSQGQFESEENNGSDPGGTDAAGDGTFTVTNTGSQPCTLTGFPSVRVADTEGGDVSVKNAGPADTGGASELQPGKSASFVVTWTFASGLASENDTQSLPTDLEVQLDEGGMAVDLNSDNSNPMHPTSDGLQISGWTLEN